MYIYYSIIYVDTDGDIYVYTGKKFTVATDTDYWM